MKYLMYETYCYTHMLNAQFNIATRLNVLMQLHLKFSLLLSDQFKKDRSFLERKILNLISTTLELIMLDNSNNKSKYTVFTFYKFTVKSSYSFGFGLDVHVVVLDLQVCAKTVTGGQVEILRLLCAIHLRFHTELPVTCWKGLSLPQAGGPLIQTRLYHLRQVLLQILKVFPEREEFTMKSK